MGELHDLEIGELAPLLHGGTLSPVELCRHLLARCVALEPRLNAFISLSEERILEQARAAERELREGAVRGSLHGVPIAVKDNIAVQGEPTTAGARARGRCMPARDAVVVARLRAAGAVIFGRTNLPELAFGPVSAYHYGPTRNPWDLERYAGGSSMGSGAAVAAGLVPGALGTDTSGSIRNPAAWCGVAGLKPSFGRVPVDGVVPLSRSLDHVGPMARSARDCAVLLDVVAAGDPVLAAMPRDLAGTRIGLLRTAWDEPLADDVASSLTQAVDWFGTSGARLVDVDVEGWGAALEAGTVMLDYEAAAEFGQALYTHPEALLPDVRAKLEAGCLITEAAYLAARRTAGRFGAELREVLGRVDVLLLPARDRTAPRIDEVGRLLDPPSGLQFALPLNVAGLPALVVPCGFDRRGLPIGLQLVGRGGDDRTVLDVACAFQADTDWHTRRPAATGERTLRTTYAVDADD
jgi:aspartyl-tRNA(Asn)/glutamyl-tRNA(Gln) amidotransferase subunit A